MSQKKKKSLFDEQELTGKETINYRPGGRDMLDGSRKTMAVQTIEPLLYCVKYPKLHDILLQVLLSKWKAAVLTALDIIYYNHIKNSKFKEALKLLVRSSKDEWIRNKAQGILNTWEN